MAAAGAAEGRRGAVPPTVLALGLVSVFMDISSESSKSKASV
jgi:hypothetical protein